MKQIKVNCETKHSLPLDQLKDFQGNLKTITKENLESLKRSILKHGIISPAFVWKSGKTNYILDAHQRTKALYSLNEDGWIVPDMPVVYINAKSRKDAKEILLKISSQYGEFENEGFIDFTDGFDLENLFNDISLAGFEFEAPVNESETFGDDEVNEDVQSITKKGSLWEIGKHRVFCGDSTNNEDVSELMSGAVFDSLFTSPPYNQGGGNCTFLTNGKGKKNAFLYKDNKTDDKTENEYFDFLIKVLKVSENHKADSHVVIWNVAYNAKSRDDYGRIIFSDENPYKVKDTIIWDKGHSINLPASGIYSRRCEFVFVMSSNEKYRTTQEKRESRWNIYNISSNKSQKTGDAVEHRAAFPVEFALKVLEDFTFNENIIYEPFCGTGTTLIAAEKIDRICYGIELDQHYCDVIVKRYIDWCNANERTPVVKLNGKDFDIKKMA